MRVLVFTTLFPNAAAPHHAVFVAERLRQLLLRGGIEARVVAPVPWFPFRQGAFGRFARFARAPRLEAWHGVPVAHPRYLVLPKIGMLAAPRLLALGARQAIAAARSEGFDFDVIDAHYLYPDGVAAAHLSALFERPLVLTARGSDVNLIAQLPRPRRAILRALARAAAIITVSGALRDELVRLGAEPSRIRVLRNGVDLERFRPLDRQALRLNLGWQGRMLLMVARLVAGKGHELALQTLAALPDDYRLAIAGDGPLRRPLERLASRSGIADRVEFLGGREHADMPGLFAAADALLLPSEREGMPNVVLEALACGTPVVACDVGGVREIMDSADAGIVIRGREPAALASACQDVCLHGPERAKVRAHAERFGWAAVSELHARILRTAAGHRA